MIGNRAKTRNSFLAEVDEKAFTAWATQGSLVSARRYFIENKVLTEGNKIYSIAGIRYCAMRHMTRNHDSALAFILEEYHKKGIYPNQETIELTLIGYAVEVLHYKKDVYEWAEKNNLLEKYQDYIDERTKNAPLESRRRIHYQ